MKNIFVAALIAAGLLTACAVVPAGRHGELTVVPLLPPLVVLDTDPFYFHGGFYYHYSNDAWTYSRSRSGPWTDLPRDHYPKEVRYRDKVRGRDGGWGHDNRRR